MKVATLALAASVVSTGLAALAHEGSFKLGFNVKRGNTYDEAVLGAKPKAKKPKKGKNVEAIISNQRTFYALNVTIGSQHDNVEVLMDTGSSDLWVSASNVKCLDIPSEDEEDEADYFDVPYRKRDLNATKTSKESTVTEFPGESLLGTLEPSLTQTESTINPYDIDYSTFFGHSSYPESYCTTFGSFNTAGSDTFHRNESIPPFFIEYGDDTAALGVWGTDDVFFDGIDVKNLTLGIANTSSSQQGVFGIGLEGLEASVIEGVKNPNISVEYPNLPAKLQSEGLIKKRLYSLYLGDRDAVNGTVLFGAVDHAKYEGELGTVPILNLGEHLKQPNAFYVLNNGISFHSKKVNRTLGNYSFPALLDSGTTLTYLPPDLFNEIGSYLNGVYDEVYEQFVVPCTIDPSVYFELNFSGKKIKVPLTDYLNTIDHGDRDSWTHGCYLGLQNSGGQAAIFGDNFLRSAYVVYDLEDYQISLAQVKYTDKEDIEVISKSISGASKAPRYSSTSFALLESRTIPLLDTFVNYPTHTLTASDALIQFVSSSNSSSSSSTGKAHHRRFVESDSSAGTYSLSLAGATVVALLLLILV